MIKDIFKQLIEKWGVKKAFKVFSFTIAGAMIFGVVSSSAIPDDVENKEKEIKE